MLPFFLFLVASRQVPLAAALLRRLPSGVAGRVGGEPPVGAAALLAALQPNAAPGLLDAVLGGPAAASRPMALAQQPQSPPVIPSPPVGPSPLDALRAAAAARTDMQLPPSTGDWDHELLHPAQQRGGSAPLVPAYVAEKAAQLAWAHLFASAGGTAAAGAAPHTAINAAADAAWNDPLAWQPEATTMWPPLTSSTPAPGTGPRLGPPPPPACAEAPPSLTAADVRRKLAPFAPPGAAGGSFQGRQSYQSENATIWPLADGGWGFQYPDMYARVHAAGQVEVSWANGEYTVSMEDDRQAYHSKNTVVHQDAYGSLVYHQPSGTMHQRGDEVIYHWCTPNVIVYQTPSGLIYYDDQGMTFRGASDLAHYASNGDVIYQGEGGITYQRPNGELTHWTGSGAIYRRANGTLCYTPTGESKCQPLSPAALGPDPFPGPPLSAAQVLAMVASMITTTPPPALVIMTTPAPMMMTTATTTPMVTTTASLGVMIGGAAIVPR